MAEPPPLAATYLLPIKAAAAPDDELVAYVRAVAQWCDVVVVDGSAPAVFAAAARAWGAVVTHVPPDADLAGANGKVNGVLTGLRRARHEAVVIADDDVRYDRAALERVVALLGERGAAAVRPQNYFAPLPWHARWDTARTLLNRAGGGDFPGTLAVRRSVVAKAGGYDPDVLFENLELLRTVEAMGGRVVSAADLYVARRPPTAHHFFRQRVRQAYDELARPHRMAMQLVLVPSVLIAVVTGRRRWLLGAAALAVGTAEAGRRRAGGRAVFPATSAWWAPAWLLERGVCAWWALGARARGGARYSGGRLRRAATSPRRLRTALPHPYLTP
jgi:cellulose synthase/poly-beta-1,6-N-acetylglucosamine synthase-like glycosyltransferase